MSISIASNQRNFSYKIESVISNYLISLGFKEIMNNSLTNNNLKLFNRRSIKIINSISNDVSELRTTLLESCMKTLKYNLNRNNINNKYFEFGKIYVKERELTNEKRRLGILFSGGFFKETWITNKNIKNEIFLLKNILKNIFEKFSVNYKEISVDMDGFKYSLGYYDNNKRFANIRLRR